MLLSVIIVNYNVKYFLEQCLCSLEKSLRTAGLSVGGPLSITPRPRPDLAGSTGSAGDQGDGDSGAEIFVVDNHSSDGSMEWLLPRFPTVQFIANQENRGFARANNQALAKASGQYVLFLNPDTILAEDSIGTVLAFMGSTPSAGAAGVRMVDGGGRFLKESRRGFPSPWVAFCKLTGLTTLFPRSSFFASYYLGHIPASATHPAPILSGAFMLVRKQALDRTGGFDEQFFLYAEDIDLSYRIEKAGYTNYYIADTTILHFKGESTQKDARYIKLFYKAMSQFRRKHFKGGFSPLFNALMETAIWLRAAGTAAANRFKSKEDGGKTRDGFPGREIILHEGEDLSFKDIIDSIQNGPEGAVYMIRSAAGSSAVGSRSKDGRGETLFFPPKA